MKRSQIRLLAQVFFAATVAFFIAASARAQDALLVSLEDQINERIQNERIGLPAHFFVLYTYEGRPNIPAEAHTFASFIEIDIDGVQHWSSISWMPADFAERRTVCIFGGFWDAAFKEILGRRCQPESGRNYSVEETLGWARESGKPVKHWGPVRITREFYLRSQARIAFLNNKGTNYIADDRRTRSFGTAINCMHAISDMGGVDHPGERATFDQLEYGQWGVRGSRSALEQIMRKSDWFLEGVNLGEMKIDYRNPDPRDRD